MDSGFANVEHGPCTGMNGWEMPQGHGRKAQVQNGVPLLVQTLYTYKYRVSA